MSYRVLRASSALLILLTLPIYSSSRQMSAQENQLPSRKSLTVVPYYSPLTSCYPVRVKVVSIGAQPPEVLTSQVTIESLSDKPAVAIKLRWDVYDRGMGLKKARSSCDATPEEAEIYLSGDTPLIQVGRLVKGERYNISTKPLTMKSPFPVTKTIFVDQPIIAWDDVKVLTLDGTRDTFKGDYAAVIYVSEVRFEDGTKWEGVVK